MVWLIIALVIGLMLSPMMWLRPSSQQKRMGRLRQAVTNAGVKVKLGDSPLHEGGRMASYRWMYPGEYPGPRFVLVREAVASDALKPFMHGWRWRIEPLRPLPGEALAMLELALGELPVDAQVVESSRDALTLWWGESLGADAFEHHRENLSSLQQHLAGRPDEPAPRKLGVREMRDQARR
ncbi:preprotein translocase subunit YajC [Onishia niordana]|uniref:preprotein translocase subunit YajC n=1 Tax=Onishia niordana TaxID=2508711 RepID=UPI0010A06861|nr:preprotein translocase subunit YajC [Halomonas niordiana]